MLRRRVGWPFVLGASLSVVAVAACVGEDPDGLSSERDAGAVDAGAEDGAPAPKDDAAGADAGGTGPDATVACEAIPGNLVQNPSFENGFPPWLESDADAKVRTDGPADCAAFVEVQTTAAYGRVHQNLDLSSLTPGAMGKVEVEFGASVRSLDGDFSQVEVVLGDITTGSTGVAAPPVLPADGSWTTTKGTTTITPGSAFYIRVQAAQIRKFGVDRVWVVQKN